MPASTSSANPPTISRLPTQLIDWREGLRGVDLGDKGPVDTGNRQRSPRSKRRDTAVAYDLARTFDTGDCGPTRLGIDALMQHRRPVSLNGGDLLIRGTAGLEFGEVDLAILVKCPRARAHQIIGPDEIGLAGVAEPFLPPAATASDDVVDLLVQQLRDQNADDAALVNHRCCHESIWCTARRTVRREVLQADSRLVGTHRTAGDGGRDA